MTHRKPLPEGQNWRLMSFSFFEKDVERLDALLVHMLDEHVPGTPVRDTSRSAIVRRALAELAERSGVKCSTNP